MLEGLIERLLAARDFRPQGYVPLELGAERIGWIRRDQADRLRAWPRVFEFSEKKILLRPAPEAVQSAALAEVARALARDGAIQDWRGETYAIGARAGAAPAFHLERSAMRFFGFTSSAAHLNGFVSENDDQTILIARRASTKSIDPGMLDTLVAGGVPSGQDAWQTLLRECGEEAGIAQSLAGRSRPAGVLQVCREVPDGVHSEFLHVFDLTLPAGFAPRNADGEVSEFMALAADRLLERVARGEFTLEAGLVAADFILRHGLLRDADPRLGAAVERCRAPRY